MIRQSNISALKAFAGRTAGAKWALDTLSLLGPYLGLLLVIALFSYFTWRRGELDRFLSTGNAKVVAVHAAITATVALGMTIIMISGGIDLSVGYVVSLVTVVAMLAYRWANEQAYLAGAVSIVAVAAGLGTGAACGWINGMVITRFKVIPFVTTLGMMGVARGLAQYWAGGKPVPFPNFTPPDWVRWLGAIEPEPSWLGIGPSAWSVLIFAVFVAMLLRWTVLGRHCFAIGSNETAARFCGINVERSKVVLYSLAGLLTGWAGILQFARMKNGLHDAAPGLELEVIAAVVIGGGSLSGGEGSVSGTLVGALLITILSNGCSKLELQTEFRFIIIGVIIVAVAALNHWRRRWLR